MENHNQQQLDETRKQFDLMSNIAIQIRSKLEEERNNPPNPDLTQQSIQACAEQASSLKSKLKRNKEASKARQEEINSWQAWFEGLDQEDVSAEIQQLEKEVSWRREDISRLEKLIGELYNEIHLAELEQAEKEAQLMAISNGVLDAPIDEDPRLAGLLEELDALQQKMNALYEAQ